MDRRSVLAVISSFTLTLLGLSFFGVGQADSIYGEGKEHLVVFTPSNRPIAVAQYNGEPKAVIRVLILKHCREQMAHDDANLAIRGVEKAAQKGLKIEVIGNHVVTNMEEFRRVLNENVKKNAATGDTLVIHTIGHGHGDGSLMFLGQRSGVTEAIASAAEANSQQILWWQLSCHAAARLPSIQSLSDLRQRLLSMIASSPANQESPAGVEGRIMEGVFVAIASGDPNIDPNQDGIITVDELRSFLNRGSNKRGDLLFARSPQDPIFGIYRPANDLPIRDPRNPGQQFPRDFIPYPDRVMPFQRL